MRIENYDPTEDEKKINREEKKYKIEDKVSKEVKNSEDKNNKLKDKVENLLSDFNGKYYWLETSKLGLKPADIILFDYEGSKRFGLIVSSSKAPLGMRLSTRLNVLLNVFLIDSLTDSMFFLTLDNLYGKESRCTYERAPTIISSFISKDRFRTFILKKASDIKKIIMSRAQIEQVKQQRQKEQEE